MNFVSGGVKVGDKVTKGEEEDDEGSGPPTVSEQFSACININDKL